MVSPEGNADRDLRDRILHLELDVKLLTHMVQYHSGFSQSRQPDQPVYPSNPYQPVRPVEPVQPPVEPYQPVYPSEPSEPLEPVEPVQEELPEEEIQQETEKEEVKQPKVPEPEVVEGENFKDTILKSLAKNLSTSIGMIVLASGTAITSWIQGTSYKPQEVPKEIPSVSQQTNQPTQSK